MLNQVAQRVLRNMSTVCWRCRQNQ